MKRRVITMVVTMYWFAGVVVAASLLPDDQYSPQRSTYERDAARGPRGYPNWLEYHRDSNTKYDPPDNNSGSASPSLYDSSRDQKSQKDSKLSSPVANDWDTVDVSTMTNFTEPLIHDLDVPDEDFQTKSSSSDDPYDNTFQDQGPGSVEIYKLDLLPENAILVPQSKRKQPPVTSSRIKNKFPKKARSNEIIWKVKTMETPKTLLPELFRQPPLVHRDETTSADLTDKSENDRKDVESSVGGVPELQVGCEGLEATDRRKRSPTTQDDDYWPKFKDPVYRESTEPILLRVTPIVLDLEDEPPSGRIYEELDELLKLKITTTPEPTTKRANRGDIDPALENYQRDRNPEDEKLPERGDLGPNSVKDPATVDEASFDAEEPFRSDDKGVRLPREAQGSWSSGEINDEQHEASSSSIESPSKAGNPRSGRKLLWVQYPSSQPSTRHRPEVEDQRDLWGFGEDDGEIPDDHPEDAEELRKVEERKRRQEYERRRHEEAQRRRNDRDRQAQSRDPSRRTNDTRADNDRIREEYERRQEQEQRERRRLEEERRKLEVRRQWEDHRRRIEETRRRQSEETKRRQEEEEARRNRDPAGRREEEERRRQWNRRRQEEESRRNGEQDNQAPPSALTRQDHRPDNRSNSSQDEDSDNERKLREYVERNRPIDLRKNREERRRLMEKQQREEHLREERRREESRRDYERRRQMEEQRRRDRPDESPVDAVSTLPKRGSAQAARDEEERRRTMNEAIQWERARQQHQRMSRTRDGGRGHGPSALTSPSRQSHEESSESRRERERIELMRFQEEGRRREEEYRRGESQRHAEELRRLEHRRRIEESRRRGHDWTDNRRIATTNNSRLENESRDPSEIRRADDGRRTSVGGRRNQDEERRRRIVERERQRQRQAMEERERMRNEQEGSARNNGRRRPQDVRPYEQRQRSDNVGIRDEAEIRRREVARLNALPVSARIVVRSDRAPSRNDETVRDATAVPPTITVGSRNGFPNEIDFPAINPNRPGLEASRFPAPVTERPPSKGPSACEWAIVNCCPANDRLTTCFESMGCPGINWDPSPCDPSVLLAAQKQVLSFYETWDDNYGRA